MRFSLIIPMYCEEEIVLQTLSSLTSFLNRYQKEDCELIFCDDGSTDKTVAVLQAELDAHPAQYQNVRLLTYSQNRGKGYAVRYAMLQAKGDFVLFTDCDLAYGTDLLSDFLSYYEENSATCDAVIGSRALHEEGLSGYSRLRRLMSRAYVGTVRLLTHTRLHDTQTGIKGFSRKAVQEVFPLCETDRFAFDLEILLFCERLGYPIKELPVKILQNRNQASKIRPVRDTFSMLRDILRIRRHVKKAIKKR